MSLDETFTEVRELAAWMGAHGRLDCRKRILDVLAAPLTDRDRAGVLLYEISMILDRGCPGDLADRLAGVRDSLTRAVC